MSAQVYYRIAVVDVYTAVWHDLKKEVNDEVQDNERIVAVQYEESPGKDSGMVYQPARLRAILTLESPREGVVRGWVKD